MKNVDTNKLFLFLAAFAALLSVIFLLVNNISIYGKRKAVEKQAENLQKQIQELRAETNILQGSIIQSQQADYLEKIAREQFNLQKPGEKVFAFPSMVDKPAVPATTTEQGTLWQKILDKVK